MKKVRLFVLQDNLRRVIDVPYGQHTEAQADLEMSGATIYHASVLSQPKKSRKLTAEARLRQRLY
jgi:hypothetical protein